MTRRGVKRPAVRVRRELEEYTLARGAARQKRRGWTIRLARQADGAEAKKFGGEGSR